MTLYCWGRRAWDINDRRRQFPQSVLYEIPQEFALYIITVRRSLYPCVMALYSPLSCQYCIILWCSPSTDGCIITYAGPLDWNRSCFVSPLNGNIQKLHGGNTIISLTMHASKLRKGFSSFPLNKLWHPVKIECHTL